MRNPIFRPRITFLFQYRVLIKLIFLESLFHKLHFEHLQSYVTPSFTNVLENWIDCLLRLVSHDYDHKQWNKADMFDMFISPERNSAKRLQKERFNSLVYSCPIAIHLDEKVTQFLLKYDHITNQLACICRRFKDLEFVLIMAATGVIVGMHLV